MAFAYQFRFRPWDVDRLTLPEFSAFCSAIDHLGEGAV